MEHEDTAASGSGPQRLLTALSWAATLLVSDLPEIVSGVFRVLPDVVAFGSCALTWRQT